MRICIDLQAAVGQPTGVGRYVAQVWNGLAGVGSDVDVSGVYFDFLRRGLSPDVKGRALRSIRWLPGSVYQKAWRLFGAPSYDRLSGRSDLYFFPNFVAPPVRRGKVVSFVHDVTPKRFPQTVEAKNLAYLEKYLPASLERCAGVLAPTRAVSDEIAEHFDVPRERIFPVWHGVDASFIPQSEEVVRVVLKRLSLENGFLLSVSTVEPRKNYGLLIEAFEHIASNYTGKLVIAGQRGWKSDDVYMRAKSSKFADRIVFLDYVSFPDLLSLYSGCDLFLSSAMYEGFGFAPLEALACGAPVVASDIAAHREVLQDAADLVEGFDPTAWAERMTTALENKDDPAARSKGRRHAGTFTWTKTAHGTLDAFRKILT